MSARHPVTAFVSLCHLSFRTTTRHLTSQVSPGSTRTVCTTRASPTMTLPSIDTLRTARFPQTVEYASEILSASPLPSSSTSTSSPGTIPDEHLRLLTEMLESGHGARGVFVALLSDPSVTLADTGLLDNNLIKALVNVGQTNGTRRMNEEGVEQARYIRELGVKNVVMPAAMVVAYGLEDKEELKMASKGTCERAQRVLTAWDMEEGKTENGCERVRDVAREMKQSLTRGGAVFDGFVNKWEYSKIQRDAMVGALDEVFDEL